MSSFTPWSDAISLLQAANLVDAQHFHKINEPFEQPVDGNWLAIEAYSDLLNPVDIGGSTYEERGYILIYCVAPFGTGTDTLRVLAKAVADTFRGLPARNPFYGNATIGVGSPSEGGESYVIPVTVAFCWQDTST